MSEQECGNVAGEWKSLQCLTSVSSFHPNTPSSYLVLLSAALPENMRLCKVCVCVSILFLHTCRFIWPARVSALQGQGLSLCVYVCVIRSDVYRELECKHQVKLCLLSFWVSLIDSPLELALIVYQVLYHEGRVGKGDRMYLDRAWSYLNKSLWFVTFSNILSPFGRHLSKAPYNSLTAYTLNKSDHK